MNETTFYETDNVTDNNYHISEQISVKSVYECTMKKTSFVLIICCMYVWT